MNSPHDTQPTGYLELIRSNANFRWLWFGQIISLFGDWFNLIASAALIAALAGLALDRWSGIAGLLQVMALLSLLPALTWGFWTHRRRGK